MRSTVRLLAVPSQQMANRQFALGMLFVYSEDAIEDVKVSGNLIQDIKVPYRDDFDKVNMAEIGGRYYDIIGIDNQTYFEQSSILRIRFNPICSILKPGMAISGWWDRTPVQLNPGERLNIGNDTLAPSRRVNLPALEGWEVGGTQTHKPMFVQISAKYDTLNANSSTLTLYSTFAPYFPDIMSYPYVASYTGSNGRKYIPLMEIISNLDELTNIPSDSIIDVAISPRCPWRYSRRVNSGFDLLDANGAVSTPQSHGVDWTYNIINKKNIARDPNMTIDRTLGLTAFERYCGRVTLVDETGTDICEIPTSYFNSGHALIYRVGSVSDINGIYTQLVIKGKIYTLPEGHLPWIGDAWADYSARSLSYDREALGRAVDTVNRQREIDNINAVAGGIMTASVGAISNPIGAVAGLAQMGLGVATAGMSADLAKSNLYADQAAKEGNIKASPSANYQTAHGLDYCYRSFIYGGAHFRIETPANLSSSDFDNYIAYRGWPCGKYASFNILTGYVKGNIFGLTSSTDYNGPELDLLRQEIAQGFRMVTI